MYLTSKRIVIIQNWPTRVILLKVGLYRKWKNHRTELLCSIWLICKVILRWIKLLGGVISCINQCIFCLDLYVKKPYLDLISDM